MILFEIVSWIINHWGEVTLNAVLLLILRKFILSEVHKLIYFNRDEEMQWMRSKLEELTGEKWSGLQPIWKRVETRYIKNYSLFSRMVSKQKRRKKIMERLKSRKLWMAIFGALLPIINEQFNLGLNTDTVIASVGAIIMYILGQAHVDATSQKNGGSTDAQYKGDGPAV